MDKRGHTMIKNRLVAAGAAAALATGTALMAVPAHAAHDGRFRALLSAPREGASAVDTGEATASLRWFDTVNRCL
ncbi:hypothetical protein LI935_09340, partial [Cutibacterium acnes]|nr:hypothetical protein [Cutibacterium acnes]